MKLIIDNMPIDELQDSLTLAFWATLFGSAAVFLLSFVGSALSAIPIAGTLLNMVLLIYFGSQIPREYRSFIGILIVTLALTVVQGVIGIISGMLGFNLSFLQWANIASVTGLISTIVAAVTGLYIADKVGLG